MQVASAPSLRLPLPPAAAESAFPGQGAAASGAPRSGPVAGAAAASRPAASSGEEAVTLSPQAAGTADAGFGSPIFAEIWKDGQKLAEVDSHGRVISHSGLVPPLDGGTLAGPLLAAQRAVQVAQQVGGEIRSAGQTVDRDTLLMRARLARTYGAVGAAAGITAS